MPVLKLGNDDPVQVRMDDEDRAIRTKLTGPVVTTVGIPDDQDDEGNLSPLWDINEAFMTVTHPTQGVWSFHSDATPAWVSCPEWPELEQRLAGYYGAERGIQPGYGEDETVVEEDQ
jgi:hypothetical protein